MKDPEQKDHLINELITKVVYRIVPDTPGLLNINIASVALAAL